MKKEALIATFTLVGTVIGAGILGIPYVISKSGFLAGLIHIIFLGSAMLLLNLHLGEIALRTKGHHQLTGYMRKYLGKWGKRLMALSMLIGIYGALIAYLLGTGEAAKSIFGGSALLYSLIFFIIVSLIIYFGLKATGWSELIIVSALIFIVIIIGLFSFKQISLQNLLTFNPSNFFVPYGVILFAFIGTAAIPEVDEILKDNPNSMKKAILLGSTLPIILYIIFSSIVIGLISFQEFQTLLPNEKIATVALQYFTSPIMGVLANLFAIAAMFTSFIALALALRQMYEFDYNLNKNVSFLLVISVPFLVALSHLTNFIEIIGISGSLAGGLTGILVMLAYWKAKKKGNQKPAYSLKSNKVLTTFLIIIFSLGILYQLYQFFP